LQVSALGFPIIENEGDIEDEVLDFLTWVRPRIKDVREMTPENAMKASSKDLSWDVANDQAQAQREKLSQDIFDVLLGHLDDPGDSDDYVENSEPFPIPFEIPDDVDREPMTDEDRAEFDNKKDAMPSPGDGQSAVDQDEDTDADSESAGQQAGEQTAEEGSPSDADDAGQPEPADSSGETDDASQEGQPPTDDDADVQPDSNDQGEQQAAGDDPMVCSDCGTELVQRPRNENSEADPLSDVITDGGIDMMYVCPDCGREVDPETGEHQGADEQGDTESSGEGSDGGLGGDQAAPEDESDDGEPSTDSTGDTDATDQGDDGPDEQETPESDGETEGDGDGRQDPFSEQDGTTYDDEDHGVKQFSREELARERDDMMTLAKHKNVAANYGVENLVSDVEDRFVRRYQKIKTAEKANEDSVYVRQMARDERVTNNLAAVASTESKQAVLDGDLRKSIEDAFQQLKTRNRYVEQQVGEDLSMDGVITNRSTGTEIRANYKHMQRAEKGDRAVGVALDMSGSMNEYRAKVAVGALYTATKVIGDSFTASAFMMNQSHRDTNEQSIQTPLITGPTEGFQWDHLDGLTTNSRTPTASGIIDGESLLQEASRPEKVLLVITDGRPNVAPDGNDNSTVALDAAASAVQRARSKGLKVIGLGVGSVDESNMKAMFGANDYLMADMESLAETLLKIYRRQMTLVQDGSV
jgi:Mg-chelatase subunit ChlD